MVESYHIDNDTQKKWELTPQDCTIIRDNFKAYDKNNDGTMERSELRKVLKDLGHDDLTEEQIEIIFSKIDTNSSGKIEYPEFVAMYGTIKEKGFKAVAEAIETIKGVSKRSETKDGGHRTYHVEEVSVCTRFINSNLGEDEELKAAGVLPIDPDSEDVFF
jgi:hypothetical protein